MKQSFLVILTNSLFYNQITDYPLLPILKTIIANFCQPSLFYPLSTKRGGYLNLQLEFLVSDGWTMGVYQAWLMMVDELVNKLVNGGPSGLISWLKMGDKL